MRTTTRRALQIGIVAAWLVAVGLLAQRELSGPRHVDLTQTARLEEPTETRLGLFLRPGTDVDAELQRVGTVEMRQTPEMRTLDGQRLEGIDLDLEVTMSLSMFGRVTDFSLTGEIFRPYSGDAADFAFGVTSGESDFQLEGGLRGDALEAEVRSAGTTIPLSAQVDGDLVFSSGFGTPLTLPALRVGDEVAIDTFDPLSMSATTSTVRCTALQTLEVGGETIQTRRLLVTASGLETTAWVDDAGEVVRAETALGLILERLTPDAPEPATASGPALAQELLQLTAIFPTGERPLRGARELLVQLGGELPEGGLPQDGTQRAEGERLYRLLQGGGADEQPSTFEPYLAADAFVQSSDDAIRSQSARILEGAGDDARERAYALADWVFENLEKQPVLSVPSALEVLQMKKGDCNEHTVLYAALARAAGIPTKIAIGVVWSDLLGGFYYHAWPEVWVGDRWLWIDPTLGQREADATHLKLFNGGIQTWTQLLPYLGQLEIEVVEQKA